MSSFPFAIPQSSAIVLPGCAGLGRAKSSDGPWPPTVRNPRRGTRRSGFRRRSGRSVRRVDAKESMGPGAQGRGGSRGRDVMRTFLTWVSEDLTLLVC